jgi:hypothetical protein
MAANSTASELVADEARRVLAAEEERRRPFRERAQEEASKRDEWRRRWSLALSVGNAAGAVGLTSGLLSAWSDGPPRYVFLVGLWLFVLGLLIGGILPYIFYRHHRARHHHQNIIAHTWEQAGARVAFDPDTDDDTPVLADDLIDRYWRERHRTERGAARLEALSATLFAAGVLVPLVLLTAADLTGAHGRSVVVTSPRPATPASAARPAAKALGLSGAGGSGSSATAKIDGTPGAGLATSAIRSSADGPSPAAPLGQ